MRHRICLSPGITGSFEVSHADAEHLWDHGAFSGARARPRVKESILIVQETTGSRDRTFNQPFLLSVDSTQAREFFERQQGRKSASSVKMHSRVPEEKGRTQKPFF